MINLLNSVEPFSNNKSHSSILNPNWAEKRTALIILKASSLNLSYKIVGEEIEDNKLQEELKKKCNDLLAKIKDIDTEATSVTLSDKEKEVLIGKAIETLGKPAFYVRSYWKTAMGFIGSYTHKWFNGNFNEVNANRASDKAADLTYDSSKLIVLRKDIDGGYYNVDRYYSIEVSSSTKYIVDRAKIRDSVRNYYQYYDSELDWRICTLTKTGTNRKKFKQYLTDTAGVPEAQAEALTAEAFEGSSW